MVRVGIVHTSPAMLRGLQQILCEIPGVHVPLVADSLPRDFAGLDLLIVDSAALVAEALLSLAAGPPASRTLVMCPPGSGVPPELPGAGRLSTLASPDAITAAVLGLAADGLGPAVPATSDVPAAGCGVRSVAALSGREHQVAACIAGGLTQEQVARRLGISRHTVDTYIRRSRKKLGPGNKADLTRLVLLGGLTPP